MKWFKALSALKQIALVVLVVGGALGGLWSWHELAKAQLVRRTQVATEVRIGAAAAGRLALFTDSIRVLNDSLAAQLGRTQKVFVRVKEHVDSNAIASSAVTAALAAIKQEQRALPEVATLIATTQQLQTTSERLRADFDAVKTAYSADSVQWMRSIAKRDSIIATLAEKATADSSIADRKLTDANKRRLTPKKAAVITVATVVVWEGGKWAIKHFLFKQRTTTSTH